MDSELRFLVHFYNDPAYLFKTITMAGVERADEICDRISAQKGWFWPRFAPSERRDYLARRLFVEKALYEDYTRAYGPLKEKPPVYFYLYPNLTEQRATDLGNKRAAQGESRPHILMVKIEDIPDTRNITFTLHDSHKAYWKRTMEAGVPCRGDPDSHVVLEDHNRVFPFAMIEEMHAKYRAEQITYEIQVWDYGLLEKLKYTILEKEQR